jgi:ERCC4-type nuclease
MYPSLSREAKAREAVTVQQRAELKRRNQQLVVDLRELNARVDERMKLEGRS